MIDVTRPLRQRLDAGQILRVCSPIGTHLPVPEPRTLVLQMPAALAPADIRRLCNHVAELVARASPDVLICDLGLVARPDAVTVDALARLQLVVTQVGCQLRIEHACRRLEELLDLLGLKDCVIFLDES